MSQTDNYQKSVMVTECLKAFRSYESLVLNGYLQKLTDYATQVKGLADQVTGTGKNYRPEDQKVFSAEAQRIYDTVIDIQYGNDKGDSLGKDYFRVRAEYKRDLDYMKDSWNRAVGCGGYPTPSGLEKPAVCPPL